MRAALPMYWRPETARAYRRFWTLIAQRVPELSPPCALSEPDDLMQFWQSDDMVLSQTCGFPYRTHLQKSVTLVATPDFALPNTKPGFYYSVIIARKERMLEQSCESWHGLRLAINEPGSQSGWAAIEPLLHRHQLRFSEIRVTGAHRLSARAVYDGTADIAAIDSITWRDMLRYDPWTCALGEVASTEPSPGLPYITALPKAAPILRMALPRALAALEADARATLGLRGFIELSHNDYLVMAQPKPPEFYCEERIEYAN